jgi:predicted RNase H-like HicB family nuclease
MTPSARYAKVVEWSEEDQCFVGSAPGLIYGGYHGSDERRVFDELCEIVDEIVGLYVEEGAELPPATAGQDLANRIDATIA